MAEPSWIVACGRPGFSMKAPAGSLLPVLLKPTARRQVRAPGFPVLTASNIAHKVAARQLALLRDSILHPPTVSLGPRKNSRRKRSRFIPAARLDRYEWQSCVLPRLHAARNRIGVRIAHIAQDMGGHQTPVTARTEKEQRRLLDCMSDQPPHELEPLLRRQIAGGKGLALRARHLATKTLHDSERPVYGLGRAPKSSRSSAVRTSIRAAGARAVRPTPRAAG